VIIPVTFTFPGNYSLYFHVTDRGGGQASTVWYVSVRPSQTSQLVVPCAPSGLASLHTLENGTYNLACASGGTPPYSYAWVWADSTVTQGGSSATHNYQAPGHYNVTVMVRDALGAVAFAQSLEVTVNGSSIQNPPTLPCSPTGPTNLSVGAMGDYSISCVAGGVAPFSYTWEFQDGTTVAGDSAITHQFSRSGTFEVVVLVTDALGRVASSSPLKVTVTATVHTTSGRVWTTLTGSAFLYPLLLVVALATASVAYLAVRKYRRRNKNQGNAANDETRGDAHDGERTNENESEED
jgi:PKD repeat protein